MLLHYLDTIQHALRPLQSDASLNAQQQIFVDHMQRTTEKLYAVLAPVPPGKTALYDILPTIPQSFEQSLSVLYGYARMLMTQPDSFEGQGVTSAQKISLTTIYDASMALSQDITQHRRDMFAYRVSQRQQSAAMMDITEILEETLPVCRYYLRDTALRFTWQLDTVPQAFAHPYHLNALIKHILTTIADELLEYGTIRLHLQQTASTADITIFATGLTGNDEEYKILFQKEGRHLYRQQFEQYGGHLKIMTHPGQGITLYLQLPLSSVKSV
ncbi:MAG: hypothetical protein ACPG7F_01320 [Aggregatilineales bacterium]